MSIKPKEGKVIKGGKTEYFSMRKTMSKKHEEMGKKTIKLKTLSVG
jgi:hypothetical protein